MLDLSESYEKTSRWISTKGRINRKEFWLLYMLPAAIVFVLGADLEFSGLIALWIFGAGLLKRMNDINVSRALIGGLVGSWWVVLIIAGVVAFVLFLGGISGAGNMDMLGTAALVIAVPMAAILLLPLFAGIKPGLPEENKHGPVPEPLSQARLVSSMVSTGLLAVALLAVQGYVYFAYR